MKVVAIIQARLGSTRLPRKVLADIAGRPMIDHVVERAQAINGIDEIILNVPATDKELIDGRYFCYGVKDQEQDVLGSYLKIADIVQADVIMRLTGDCPMLAPDASAMVLKYFLEQKGNYVTNVGTVSGEKTYTQWADGWDTEVFSMEVLRDADRFADTPYHRQHVTSWIRRESSFDCFYMNAPADYSALKCSVDTHQDLDRVRAIYAAQPVDFSYQATWDAWERAGRP